MAIIKNGYKVQNQNLGDDNNEQYKNN